VFLTPVNSLGHACWPCTGSPGDLERETMILLLVLHHFLPSPCANFSNKSAMVGVMTKGHPNADTLKPLSKVGCPPQDVVTLRGDPVSPPSHSPCPSPPESFPTLLTKMAGYVDQCHGVPCLAIVLSRSSRRVARLMFKLLSMMGKHP
jgi:hypothetical protein